MSRDTTLEGVGKHQLLKVWDTRRGRNNKAADNHRSCSVVAKQNFFWRKRTLGKIPMPNECKWYSRSSSISQAFPSYDSKCAEVCQGTQLLKIRTLDMVEKWQTWNPTTWGTNKEKQKPQTFNLSSLLSDPGPALNRAKWLQDDTTDSNTSRVFNSPRDASRPFAVVHNFWLNILCSIMQLSRRCVGFSSARWPLNDGQPGLRVCSFVWTKGFQMDRNQHNREKKVRTTVTPTLAHCHLLDMALIMAFFWASEVFFNACACKRGWMV